MTATTVPLTHDERVCLEFCGCDRELAEDGHRCLCVASESELGEKAVVCGVLVCACSLPIRVAPPRGRP